MMNYLNVCPLRQPLSNVRRNALCLFQRGLVQFVVLALLSMVTTLSFAAADPKEPLDADQAFQMAVVVSGKQPVIKFAIADGYYLYHDRLKIKIIPQQDSPIVYPNGSIKHDSKGQVIKIYQGNISIPLPASAKDAEQVVVDYQGCSFQGFCYPPMHETIALKVSQNHANKISSPPPIQQHTLKSLLTDQHGIQGVLQSQNYFVILLMFLGLGLLLAFTPCVLPMVPILTGIIVGQKAITTQKAFLLSLTYVLGSALTYAIAGLVAALMGNSLQVLLQTPWVIMIVSLVFILLALSLFGLFELRLPSRMQTQMVNLSNSLSGGTYISVFGMGALSTLIVSPCVTAPLVGILLYIAQTGNMLLGAMALFAIGIGMGIPLLLIGTTAGKWLPKAGPWMEVIKKIFGIVMLMMAIWLLSRTMSVQMADILWKICLLGMAFAIGGYLPRFIGYQKFNRGIATIAGVCSAFMMLGSVLPNPIITSGIIQQHKAEADQPFHAVHSLTDFQTQLALAQSLHKQVILDFYADWCDSCVAMDKNVFAKPKVQQELSHYVLLRADLSANSAQDEALLKHFDVIAPPTILIFDDNGQELNDQRIVGEVDSKEFLTRLGIEPHKD